MEEDKKKYNGWLLSDNFLKRSFAVFGYYTVASVIVWVVVFIIFLFIELIFN